MRKLTCLVKITPLHMPYRHSAAVPSSLHSYDCDHAFLLALNVALAAQASRGQRTPRSPDPCGALQTDIELVVLQEG